MNKTPQELLKEYVKSQHFSSTAEIMTAMKEMFWRVAKPPTGKGLFLHLYGFYSLQSKKRP